MSLLSATIVTFMTDPNRIRIMIASGGTGGHVYPALAIAEAIKAAYPGLNLSFVGSVGGFERPLVEESGIRFAAYYEVLAGPLRGIGLVRAAWNALKLAAGTLQSLWLLWRKRPGALLLTGGWVGLPVALAAWVLRVPILIFVPDIEPGGSIRALRRFAREIAITVPDSEVYFPGQKTVLTGYPLRKQMREATRDEALKFFELDPSRRTLFVFGGSRGARAINYALLDILPALLEHGVQVIHVTGTLDWPDMLKRRDTLLDVTHYHAFPYLHQEMGLAMAAADLVVSRSGASVLGEFPQFGLPSILVPYPHAWRYQKVNADYLAGQGAALRLDESEMLTSLLATIEGLLFDDARLQKMRAASASLAHPDGSERAAAELVRLAGGTP
ncbi:MAG: UDP-N-acetylglucosamine--N-acetylmuramyl-(pentapeptide) pyrophosphoryl-undecaprenol N-acetylglucosamine transferase [Chloroflexota bacterium]